MSRRLFVAIRTESNSKMREALDFLNQFPSTKTVEDDNLHINLKFLGDVSNEELEDAKEALGEAEGFSSFLLKLKGTGAFPNKEFIKVVWLGVESDELKELFGLIEDSYKEKGFDERDKGYKPHVTLARVNSKPDRNIREIFDGEFGSKEYKEQVINKVELIESELKSSGPIYTTRKKVKL